MIVLDTNVISELKRPEPDPAVLAWVTAQPRATLYTTEINRAEVLFGVASLPPGRRRSAFEAVVTAIFRDWLMARLAEADFSTTEDGSEENAQTVEGAA